MFRVFPQDLKPGDTILRDSMEGNVLSLKILEKIVEVNVRLVAACDLRSWIFRKSEMLDLISSEEQRALYEPTVPDAIEVSGATIPAYRTPPPENVFDMDESDTNPFGGLKTIERKAPTKDS